MRHNCFHRCLIAAEERGTLDPFHALVAISFCHVSCDDHLVDVLAFASVLYSPCEQRIDLIANLEKR